MLYKLHCKNKILLHYLRIYEILVISSKIFNFFMSDRATGDNTGYHVLVLQFFSHHELYAKYEISEITYFCLNTFVRKKNEWQKNVTKETYTLRRFIFILYLLFYGTLLCWSIFHVLIIKISDDRKSKCWSSFEVLIGSARADPDHVRFDRSAREWPNK